MHAATAGGPVTVAPIVLTLYLDFSPEQAAAAMRMSLATLRRRLAEAGSARYGPSCLQTLATSRTATGSASQASQASRARTRHPGGAPSVSRAVVGEEAA